MARHSEGPWFRTAKNTWYATTADGRKVSLGVQGKGGRAEAVAAWHRLMAGASPGEPVGPAVQPPKAPESVAGGVAVREVVAAFLADAQTRCKPESMAVYRSALNRFSRRFGGRAADGLRPFEAEAFANRPDWSDSTRNTFLSAVVTAFRWAVRSGMLPANPLTGVRKPPCGSRGASAVLTPKQVAGLLAAAPPPFRLYLRGLWLTGCRPGELARVEAKDVDLANGLVILADHKTRRKTGRPRVIFLSPEAVAVFAAQAQRHPAGPLFPNKLGRAFTRFTMQKAMAAARAKAGVPHAVCYGLRHTYATDALAGGIPDAVVAELLGHSGTAMLHRHYSHLATRGKVLSEAARKVR